MWHDSIDNTSTSPTPSRKGEVVYAMGQEGASPQQPNFAKHGIRFSFLANIRENGGKKNTDTSLAWFYLFTVLHIVAVISLRILSSLVLGHTCPYFCGYWKGPALGVLALAGTKPHPRARVAAICIRLPVCGAAWQPADHHVLVALRHDGAAWQRWRW